GPLTEKVVTGGTGAIPCHPPPPHPRGVAPAARLIDTQGAGTSPAPASNLEVRHEQRRSGTRRPRASRMRRARASRTRGPRIPGPLGTRAARPAAPGRDGGRAGAAAGRSRAAAAGDAAGRRADGPALRVVTNKKPRRGANPGGASMEALA